MDLAPMAHFVKIHGSSTDKKPKQNGLPKMQDKYDYGMQKKIVKKRKYNDYFAERKINGEEIKEEEDKV